MFYHFGLRVSILDSRKNIMSSNNNNNNNIVQYLQFVSSLSLLTQ